MEVAAPLSRVGPMGPLASSISEVPHQSPDALAAPLPDPVLIHAPPSSARPSLSPGFLLLWVPLQPLLHLSLKSWM